MKAIIGRVILSIILCAMVLCFCGCKGQMGETVAEGEARHQRLHRIQRQEMEEDIDVFWLLNRPTRLSERRFP